MSGDHFYTTDDQGEGCVKLGYNAEGITGYVYTSNVPGKGLVPIYRFVSSVTGDHFYTQDRNAEFLLQRGYRQESIQIGWYMFSRQIVGTVPVYRWWGNNDHFYTTDPSGEIAPMSNYASENILGYIYTTPQTGTVALRRYYSGLPVPPSAWSRYVKDSQGGYAESTTGTWPITGQVSPCFRLVCNGRSLYYAIKVIGDQPQNRGYPLYICFHGGGSNAKSFPNENDDEWWSDFYGFYGEAINNLQSPCVFVAARGVSANSGGTVDTYDLHSQPESYVLLQRMIMNLMLPNPRECSSPTAKAPTFIDPNKVYMLGFSAGGNGVFQLSTKMSDRCAAAVAGAGHPEWATFENLANLPLRIQVGGNDRFSNGTTWIPRPPANIAVDKRLSDLQSFYGSTSLYTHRIDIVQGPIPGDPNDPYREHNGWAQPGQIDLDQPIFKNPYQFWDTTNNNNWNPPQRSDPVDSSTDITMTVINPERWVSGFTRTSVPTTIIWNLASRPPQPGTAGPATSSSVRDAVYQPQNLFYWLCIRDPTTPDYNGTDLIQASYGTTATSNFIKIQKPVAYLGFLLNNSMVDFSKPLYVCDGNNKVFGTVTLGSPSLSLMNTTLYMRGDPFMTFSKMVYLQPAGGTSWSVRVSETLPMQPAPRL